MVANFEQGESWRKVFGPFFVYLNTTTDVSLAHDLWVDAKKQVPACSAIYITVLDSFHTKLKLKTNRVISL